MKVVVVNGGPRKRWNTHQLLESAAAGAYDTGADVEFYDLYDLDYKGCRSCFACKLKDNAATVCAIDDSLSPLLLSIHLCDVLILGSPVYWHEVTGEMRSFLERLLYPCISYDVEPSSDEQSRFGKCIRVVLFLTMGVSEEVARETGFFDVFREYETLFKRLLGDTELRISCDTMQFSDYERYAARRFDAEQKLNRHKTVFAKEKQEAYELLRNITMQMSGAK